MTSQISPCLLIIFTCGLRWWSQQASAQTVVTLDITNAAMKWSVLQLNTAYSQLPVNTQPARVDHTTRTGAWLWYNVNQWTAGFFSGCFWELQQIYKLTGLISASNPNGVPWSTIAISVMQNVAPNAFLTNTADIGFILQTSFGESLSVMGSTDTSSPPLLLQGAQSESSRFVSMAGCVRSWDNSAGQPSSWVQVIIDNMMNLELMLASSQLPGGSTTWYNQAISHARQTAANHVRPDGSTYHLVIYSSVTGAVIQKTTVQGYSATSCWSRGQAWAIAGFTMVYRYTQLPDILATAMAVADYFVTNLAPDFVPVWDFNAPPSLPYKDTSAASAAAVGLIELDFYAPGRGYLQVAVNIVNSLTQSYLSSQQQPSGLQYESILLNGSANVMAGGYDGGLIYGDFYYLKALRLILQQQGGTFSGSSSGTPTTGTTGTGSLQGNPTPSAALGTALSPKLSPSPPPPPTPTISPSPPPPPPSKLSPSPPPPPTPTISPSPLPPILSPSQLSAPLPTLPVSRSPSLDTTSLSSPKHKAHPPPPPSPHKRAVSHVSPPSLPGSSAIPALGSSLPPPLSPTPVANLPNTFSFILKVSSSQSGTIPSAFKVISTTFSALSTLSGGGLANSNSVVWMTEGGNVGVVNVTFSNGVDLMSAATYIQSNMNSLFIAQASPGCGSTFSVTTTLASSSFLYSCSSASSTAGTVLPSVGISTPSLCC